MGCGASSGRGSKYEERESSRSGSMNDSSDRGSEAEGERKFKLSDIKETKETKAHVEKCSDTDMRMAFTVAEAYPFDENDRKKYHKEEKVYHAGDGRWHDWGTVSVVKMQKDLYCSSCRGFILDRYTESCPFFYCVRCRNDRQEGQHMEICIDCYNIGAFKTGKREKVDNPTGRDSGKISKYAGLGDNLSHLAGRESQNNAADHYGLHKPKKEPRLSLAPLDPAYTGQAPSPRASPRASANGELAVRGSVADGGASPRASPRDRPTSSESPTRKSVQALSGSKHGSMHSGSWKGTYSEGASKRPVAFNLYFDKNGSVTGHGPDQCRVQGQLKGGKVTWTETYQWGTYEVNAKVTEVKDEHISKGMNVGDISGKFKASDGGGGTLILKPASRASQ